MLKIAKPQRVVGVHKIKISNDQITLANEVAKKVKWKYCKIMYAIDGNDIIIVIKFTNNKDNNTYKVNFHRSQVRLSPTLLIRKHVH